MKNEKPERLRPRTIKIEQIKQIYDYTKYHIGFYFVLLAALGGFTKFGKDSSPDEKLLFRTITFILLVAGIAGALVASRIVYGPWGTKFFLTDKSWFWKKRNWPKRWRWWWSVADLCLIVEHYGFWIALLIAIIGFGFTGPDQSARPCFTR